MNKEQILKKYQLTEGDITSENIPCITCDAFEECEVANEQAINPFFRTCHDGFNLKLRNKINKEEN